MTIPADIHQALISADAPPQSACGDSGPSVVRAADVTCPACLDLAAARKARAEAEVHDAHAIPADDEPKPVTEAEINPGDLFRDGDGDEWVAVSTGPETFLVDPVFLHTTKQGVEEWGPLVKYDFTEGEPTSDAAVILARLSDASAPAKTHDLWVRKQLFGTLVAAESETDDRRVFILAGSALDLGRVLDALTPAQVRLLVDDLTGGQR